MYRSTKNKIYHVLFFAGNIEFFTSSDSLFPVAFLYLVSSLPRLDPLIPLDPLLLLALRVPLDSFIPLVFLAPIDHLLFLVPLDRMRSGRDESKVNERLMIKTSVVS